MPALSTNIPHADRPRQTSPDSVNQPNNPSHCLSYRHFSNLPPVSTTTTALTADAQHPRVPPLLVTTTSVIPAATSGVRGRSHCFHSHHGRKRSRRFAYHQPQHYHPISSYADLFLTYLYWDRAFIVRIGPRPHLTATDATVPGAPSCIRCIRIHRPSGPRTFIHRMGLFSHMRIDNSGIHRSIDTPSAPCISTIPPIPSPINTPSTSALITSNITTTSLPNIPKPILLTLSLHFHLTHLHGLSLANPSHRDWVNQCLEG
ncbi:hypothetical protein SprV_0200816800 [Sparganum proliferum]